MKYKGIPQGKQETESQKRKTGITEQWKMHKGKKVITETPQLNSAAAMAIQRGRPRWSNKVKGTPRGKRKGENTKTEAGMIEQ
jgi:hypothetical protein